MVKIRSDQELIEELMKRNLNYQSKSNKCVEAENDRRITGLACATPVPVSFFRSRLALGPLKTKTKKHSHNPALQAAEEAIVALNG